MSGLRYAPLRLLGIGGARRYDRDPPGNALSLSAKTGPQNHAQTTTMRWPRENCRRNGMGPT
eukprot:3830293-Lingulodinium_polyedra.AAC.1